MTLGQMFLSDLEAERTATRKCVERIPAALYEYKPHEKSMKMGYLALLVAEVPNWIAYTLEKGDIDFATFPHEPAKDGPEFARYFDDNMASAKKFLETVSDADLEQPFHLKSNGQVLMTMSKKDMISSSIRHWVHHRGQLTVYMRLNNIPVPSIYGPSADDQQF